jgi:hypothetical protein
MAMFDTHFVDTLIVAGFALALGAFVGLSMALRWIEVNVCHLKITTQLGSRSVTWTYDGPASGIAAATTARDRSLDSALAKDADG